MRLRAETARLLEFLSVQPEEVTSAETAQSLGYGVINARHRLRALAKAGLINRRNTHSAHGLLGGVSGWYTITDRGLEELSEYTARRHKAKR